MAEGIGALGGDVETLRVLRFSSALGTAACYDDDMKFALILFLGLTAASAWADCFVTMDALAKTVPDPGCNDDVCRWTFDLGDPDSRTMFEEIRAGFSQCPGQNALRDQGVNHPDFYDAWIFQFPDRSISVSIKDKSALGQTFVVLRRLPD